MKGILWLLLDVIISKFLGMKWPLKMLLVTKGKGM